MAKRRSSGLKLKSLALPAVVIVAAVGGFMLYKKHKTKQAARARAMRAIMRMRSNRAIVR